jgi:hypothetical protein
VAFEESAIEKMVVTNAVKGGICCAVINHFQQTITGLHLKLFCQKNDYLLTGVVL